MIPRRTLVTPRLRLEPVSARHAGDIHAALVASRLELGRWMAWADQSRKATVDFLRKSVYDWRTGASYVFAITEDGRAIGHIDIGLPDYPGTGDMGYWIRSDRAGRGLVSEAGAAVVEFGFSQLKLERIELRAGVGNLASCRVATKLGFRFEGRLRRAARSATGRYDCYQYGLLRTDRRRSLAADEGVRAVRRPDFTRGLVTAVVQDAADGKLLMTGFMDEAAYRRTIKTGRVWFFSRARSQLWQKGETSGNFLDVRKLTLDCDGDALLVEVDPHGPTCHTGKRSCFHNRIS
jgi:phosphoribosyl-AMP cyclohydrolase/RimJ/RimL family protein N-acetyltransferase